MKKILTLMLGFAIGSSAFAQNSAGNLHVFNDNTNHNLNLQYTIFTINPLTCTGGLQALGPGIPLPPGTITTYTTFAASTSTSTPPHPYPIDSWYNGSYIPTNQLTPNQINTERWNYIKFQLTVPGSPGSIPGLGGSFGFYQNCNSALPSTLTGTGTASGITYSFTADAFTFGGDLWMTFQ